MNIQRNTIQRQIILKAVKTAHTHPTVEEVYTQIHKNHLSISKATIYPGQPDPLPGARLPSRRRDAN